MTSSKKFTFDFLEIATNVWFLILCAHDKQWWIANKAQFNLQSSEEKLRPIVTVLKR